MHGFTKIPLKEVTVPLLGIGLGPSNLALAVALEETGLLKDSMFIEKQARFGWHEAMKLPDADMQISFVKDLVTPRNPASPYSFLNYLKAKGRLEQFINLRTFYPTRFEYEDYMKWVAHFFAEQTLYGAVVERVEPVAVDGKTLLRAVARSADGREWTLNARNLCFATGHRMKIPAFAEAAYGTRLFHTSEFLPRIEALPGHTAEVAQTRRFLVVGAGQSAAETALYLNNRFPEAQIDWCFRQFALRPMDDSHFVNEIFSGSMVDRWYGMPAEQRAAFHRDFHYANYSAVDANLIQTIYLTAYNRKIENRRYLTILNQSELVDVASGAESITATIRNLASGALSSKSYDAVVLGTGYSAENYTHMLDPIMHLLVKNEEGRLSVGRDYRVATSPSLDARVFSLGSNEESHGIGDSLLSNVAIRAQDLMASIYVQP